MPNNYDETTLPADVSKLQSSSEGLTIQPYLIVLTGQSVGSIFPLDKDEVLIGRSTDCDIVIDDDAISREHAKLIRTSDGEFMILDLGSTNGTFKNGRRITTALLGESERFRVGATVLMRLSLAAEVEESFRQLYDASVRDPLTGLHNRRHFGERYTSEVSYAFRHRTPLTVIMLDIDHFKRINDLHGHQAGDYVLQKLSEILQSSIRVEDVVARYGGEEFILLVPGVNKEQAKALGERIISLVEAASFQWNDETLAVTMSAGVATHLGQFSQDFPDLINAADHALLTAKNQGRNRVIIHS